MIDKLPRKARSYKIEDSFYNKALSRGKKQMPIANVLEQTAIAYSKGHAIYYRDKNSNFQVIVDIK